MGEVSPKSSALLTSQCIVACVGGELFAVTAGVALGLTGWATFSLSLGVAYTIVFLIGMYPIMRRERMSFATAFKAVGIAETFSIAVIEFVKLCAQSLLGFMPMGSPLSLSFWLSVLGLMAPAFVIAWPLNHLVLKRLRRR